MEKDIVRNGNRNSLFFLSNLSLYWQKKACLLLGSLLLLFIFSTPATAAVEGFLAQDSDGSYHQYCYQELLNSYALNIMGLSDGLYEDYAAKKPVALIDCVGGYIDYPALLDHYALVLMQGESFVLNKYTESDTARRADIPKSVNMVSLVSGKLERVEKSLKDKTEDEEAVPGGDGAATNDVPGEEINSGSTPIASAALVSLPEAQKWAEGKKAHQRYIDIAPLYWEYGRKTGIRPEVLYAQAALETGFGHYNGLVPSEYNNWAGIKIGSSSGNKPEDHQQFDTPQEGVRAHFNHVSAYVGLEPIGEPHDRYHLIIRLNWAGTVETVEGFSGKWAPSPAYHERIVRMLGEMKDK